MDEYEDGDLMERVRRCFRLVSEAEATQRRREEEDLRFQIPENQWTEAARKERSGGAAGGVQTPARPMLSVSLLKQPMQLVYNQFAKARLGVNLHPTGENSDKELAEIKQGIYRRIERDGGAIHARGWAFMRALAAGRGWYRVVTQYDEDADPNSPGGWDQEIAYKRILHQENVYMDPAAEEPDYSDAKWALVVGWMSKADFKRAFPDSKAAKANDVIAWEGLADTAPGWVRAAATDHDEKGVMVAEYWWKDVQAEEVKSLDGLRTRKRETVIVNVVKCNGVEALEPVQQWPGKLFPLIPVIGEELIPVDGERMYQGMIRPARDAQMAYNHAISQAVEDISRLSKAPYLLDPEQIDGFQHIWDTSNVRNYPYLPYKSIVNGQVVGPPQLNQVDGTKLQLSLAMAEQSRGMVQSATAVYEPSLGEAPKGRDQQSGRAILALQQQADAGTSQFVQNLVNVSLQYEARVVLDLMPHIYDRAGRITAIVTGEEETKAVMVGQPFIVDPQTGAPVPAQPGEPQAKQYDLSKGKYGISSDIGKSHQTRLEAGQAFLTEVVGAYPQLMEIAGDLVFQYRDEPGSKELAERLKRRIKATQPGIVDDGDSTDPAAEAQALKGQLQMMQGELQKAMQYIQTEQAKHQAQIAQAQMKAQADIEIAKMNNAAKVLVARISSDSDIANQQAEAQEELLATGLKIDAEREKQDKEHAHEVAMAAAGGRTVKMTRSRGQDNEQEEGHEMMQGSDDERSEQEQPRPEQSE